MLFSSNNTGNKKRLTLAQRFDWNVVKLSEPLCVLRIHQNGINTLSIFEDGKYITLPDVLSYFFVI